MEENDNSKREETSSLREWKSAGWLLLDEKNNVLLIHNTLGHWDIPKGKVEEGEELEQAAYRELEEETGIKKGEIEVVPFMTTMEYTYHYPNETQMIHKVVYVFAARTDKHKVKLSHEHDAYVWLPIDEAIERATYDTLKDALRTAKLSLKL